MIDAQLTSKFTWSDIVAEGKWAGWGWQQYCTVDQDRIDIDCRRIPELTAGSGMRLQLTAAHQLTLIDHVDAGFIHHVYVAKLPFEAVAARLLAVRSAQVQLAASELLEDLARQGMLHRLHGVQRRHRAHFTH